MQDNANEILARLGIKISHHNPKKDTGGRVIIDQDKNLWYISGYTLYYYIYDENRLYQMKLSEPINSVTCREGVAYAQTSKGRIYRVNVKQKMLFSWQPIRYKPRRRISEYIKTSKVISGHTTNT